MEYGGGGPRSGDGGGWFASGFVFVIVMIWLASIVFCCSVRKGGCTSRMYGLICRLDSMKIDR